MAEIVGLTLGIVALGFRLFDKPRRTLVAATTRLESEMKRREGPNKQMPTARQRISGWFSGLVPSFQPQIDTMNRLLAQDSDEQLLKFRDSYLFDTNMTSVAGAIVGQVALTATVLPGLSEAHWLARACLVVSMLAGILSVYFAVVTQKIVTGLTSARQLRDWLTVPARRDFDAWVERIDREVTDMETVRDTSDRAATLVALEADVSRSAGLRRVISGSAVMVLGNPSIILGFSLSMFLLGMGLYVLFVWVRNLDPLASEFDNRSVFAFYVASLLTMMCFFAIPLGLKRNQERKEELGEEAVQRIETLRGPPEEKHTAQEQGLLQQDGLVLQESIRKLSGVLERVIQVQEAMIQASQDGARTLPRSNLPPSA